MFRLIVRVRLDVHFASSARGESFLMCSTQPNGLNACFWMSSYE